MNYPFKKVITDIRNYIFVLNVIKKNKGTIEWEKHKLRVGWFGRIGTVVNLPPEVLYSPDAPSEIRPAYVIEESRPINEYLTKLGLQEVIMPKISPIKNSTVSWLIVYTPYFQKLSFRWALSRLFILIVLLWSQKRFEWLQWAQILLQWSGEKILAMYEFVKIK